MVNRLGPYELGPGGEHEGIYTGDARILSAAIPDESVDLIFTDPVYQNINDYRWLAETAARVLKDTGQLLVYQAHKFLPQTFLALAELRFVWLLAENTANFNTRYWPLRLFINWRPLLWYAKAKGRQLNRLCPDLIRVTTGYEGSHKWHKYDGVVCRWVSNFTTINDVIWDPFTGGGTVPAVCKMLGRRWLAFEIDPDVAETARERVRNTQPPLFVLEHEQAEMTLGGD